MKTSEFRIEVYRLSYAAQVNQRYYQIKHSRFSWWDKSVKIGVAALAIAAFGTAFVPHEWKWVEIVAAVLAALSAVVLNVVPVGEWVSEYRAMFASWNDLLLDADQLELKVRDLADDEDVHEILVELLKDLIARQCQLDDPHAPDEKLLATCQGDITERMYGNGVRTYEQAIEFHEKQNV